MPEQLTPARAVLVGHLMVTLPALAVIFGVVAILLAATQLDVLAWVIAGAPGWLTWSMLVPRWRDWVCAHEVDIDKVQPLARWTGIVWARGSFLERTELRRRNGRRGW